MSSARYVAVFAAVMFAVGLALFIGHFAINTTIDNMLLDPTISAVNESVESLQSTIVATQRLDYVGFGFMMGLMIVIMITGFLVGGNRIAMFFYFILVTIAVIISPIFSNVWETATQASVWGATTSIADFPMTNHILSKLPFYTTIAGFIGIIAMFAKPIKL